MTTASTVLSEFLSSKVDSNVAPGLMAVSFSREHGVTAQASVGRTSTSSTASMRLDTTCWMASMSKVVNSLAALVLVEKHSFPLDSSAALAEVIEI
ncbi:hypothetical protein P7C70_g7942, partial [Phenoliferia sp. Uapishka_3]